MKSCSKVQSDAGFFRGSGIGKLGVTVITLPVTALTREKYLQTLEIEVRTVFEL